MFGVLLNFQLLIQILADSDFPLRRHQGNIILCVLENCCCETGFNYYFNTLNNNFHFIQIVYLRFSKRGLTFRKRPSFYIYRRWKLKSISSSNFAVLLSWFMLNLNSFTACSFKFILNAALVLKMEIFDSSVQSNSFHTEKCCSFHDLVGTVRSLMGTPRKFFGFQTTDHRSGLVAKIRFHFDSPVISVAKQEIWDPLFGVIEGN